jgi:hypothetical protein
VRSTGVTPVVLLVSLLLLGLCVVWSLVQG